MVKKGFHRIFIPFFFLLSAVLFTGAACASGDMEPEEKKEIETVAEKNLSDLAEGLYANFETTRGNILLELEFEKTPMTVSNFVGLAEGTIENTKGEGPFYDGLIFHRVIDDFMIQGGCPQGRGTGDPGYKFPDEFDPSLRHSGPGIFSMANSGPGTNGSQFFITHVPTPWLDDKHTVFGHVIEGQDVVDSIKQGDKIVKVKIIRVGEAAEAFRPDTASFKTMVDNAGTAEKDAEKARLKGDLDFIEENWTGLTTTDSGLMYSVMEEGDGQDSPKMGQAVTVHYTGTLLDGTKFDSSIDRGQPATFNVGQVIPGWNEALMAMTKGERRLLIIPPRLGYGEQGYPGVIPPNSFLVFEVELLEF